MKKTLKDFGALTPAEEELRKGVGSGLVIEIEDGALPPADAGPERQIRASFLRYLAIGGCETCRPSETGVQVCGAIIVGEGSEAAETRGFNLEMCKVVGDLLILNSLFTDTALLRGTRLNSLFLGGCSFAQGLTADRLKATGNVDLYGVASKGSVRLPGAKIDGDLSCRKAAFEASAPKKLAFFGDRLVTGGDVFLDEVQSRGVVQLQGAKIGGNLNCDTTHFKAWGPAAAFSLQSAMVGGVFSLRGDSRIDGVVIMTNAKFGGLLDDLTCWPTGGRVYLNNCRYDAFLGGAPSDAETRLKWLGLGPDNPKMGSFTPQPYEQLASVLRESGHRSDARRVLQEKERLQRKAARVGKWHRAFSWIWDGILGFAIGYGYRTWTALVWINLFWICGVIAHQEAYDDGAFKPNNAFVLRAEEWVLCGPKTPKGGWTQGQIISRAERKVESHDTQLTCFLAQPEAASYPVFNAWTYSADTLLPIVSLEMQEYWIPDATNKPRGQLTRWFLWLQIAAGWALSLLAVAGFSGLVKGDR